MWKEVQPLKPEQDGGALPIALKGTLGKAEGGWGTASPSPQTAQPLHPPCWSPQPRPPPLSRMRTDTPTSPLPPAAPRIPIGQPPLSPQPIGAVPAGRRLRTSRSRCPLTPAAMAVMGLRRAAVAALEGGLLGRVPVPSSAAARRHAAHFTFQPDPAPSAHGESGGYGDVSSCYSDDAPARVRPPCGGGQSAGPA